MAKVWWPPEVLRGTTSYFQCYGYMSLLHIITITKKLYLYTVELCLFIHCHILYAVFCHDFGIYAPTNKHSVAHQGLSWWMFFGLLPRKVISQQDIVWCRIRDGEIEIVFWSNADGLGCFNHSGPSQWELSYHVFLLMRDSSQSNGSLYINIYL